MRLTSKSDTTTDDGEIVTGLTHLLLIELIKKLHLLKETVLRVRLPAASDEWRHNNSTSLLLVEYGNTLASKEQNFERLWATSIVSVTAQFFKQMQNQQPLLLPLIELAHTKVSAALAYYLMYVEGGCIVDMMIICVIFTCN